MSAAADELAVRDLFGQFLGGWNQGSGKAFAAPFTEEVTFIGFDGTHLTSRSDVADFHQTLFDRWLKGSRLTGEVTVRFLAPGVALLIGTGSTIMRDKTKASRERNSIQTLTAVRTPDGWRLTSFQNTRRRPMGLSGINTMLWMFTDLLWKLLGRTS